MSGYYNRNNRGITKKLGPVTAYADAVLAGYTGTREQWAQDMAKLGQNVTQVAQNTKLTTELAEQTRVNTEQVAKDTADVRRLAEETSDNAVQVASNTAESNRLAEETKQAAAQAKVDAEYAGAAADNFRVDTTLSEEGKAAEAKTTGEKFAQLSEDISDETAARQVAIAQERNRAVARENEIEELFTMPTQEAVGKWLDEHPEASTTVQDASLEVQKFTEGAKKYVVKDYIMPQMFGAKGDGVSDDTEAIQSAIKAAYEPTGTWTGCRKIFFPKGKYLVTDSIIKSGIGVDAGQFVFEGENEFAVNIISKADVLFDNVGVFGFTKFENITFSGNNSNTFMNGVGGGTGNAQSLVFENCRFRSFHTVMNVTGTTMMSEVTFNTCKIAGCGSTNNPCEIFMMNNAQAVNWRFFGTDIESFTGTLISLYAGTTMYFYQGSIIPINGNIIKIPKNANPNSFGINNSPCCVFNGVRFELHKSTLIDANAICRPVIVFRDCGMGGYNLDGVAPIIGDGGSFDARFENCFNLSGFKYDIQNINSVSGDAGISKMQFNNCDISAVSFMNNSSFTLINGNNNIAVPAVVSNGREYRKVIGRSSGAKIVDVLLTPQTYYTGDVINPAQTYNIYGTLIGLRLVSLGISNYGTEKITYTFKDGDNVLGTAEIAISGGMIEIPVGKHVDVLTVEATIPSGVSQVIAPIQIIASII